MPDFIIIGTMKSATTTIFGWLASVEGFEPPTTKEPAFFADDKTWAKGPDCYRELFAHVPRSSITGEASVIYADPLHAEKTAQRIKEVLPDVRLICSLRDPVDRMRSHYRHEVQRGREKRHFLHAVADSESIYVRRSLYYQALLPYLERFSRDQLLIVSMEETVNLPYGGWFQILDHLGLDATPPPGIALNVTSEKPRFSRLSLALWERGILNSVAKASPRWLRKVGRRVLMRTPQTYIDLLRSAEEPIPLQVEIRIRNDVANLERSLGHTLKF